MSLSKWFSQESHTKSIRYTTKALEQICSEYRESRAEWKTKLLPFWGNCSLDEILYLGIMDKPQANWTQQQKDTLKTIGYSQFDFEVQSIKDILKDFKEKTGRSDNWPTHDKLHHFLLWLLNECLWKEYATRCREIQTLAYTNFGLVHDSEEDKYVSALVASVVDNKSLVTAGAVLEFCDKKDWKQGKRLCLTNS